MARCRANIIDLLEEDPVGLADWVRVMRGHLTPAEIAERDAKAKARMAAAEQAERNRKEAAAQEAKLAAARNQQARENWREYERRNQAVKLRTAKAAGIANATLVCHPDLWAFITGRLQHSSDWHAPGASAIVEHSDGLVRIGLSGPQLASIVAYMADLARITGAGPWSGTDAEKAIARRLYDGIGLIVDQAQIAPGGTLPEILVDDRHPNGQ